MRRLLFALALVCGAGALARAEDLVSGLSQDQIQITSSYAGTDIVVFGAIEAVDPAAPATPHDIVVVVRGPDTDLSVRRKAHLAGLWINRDRIALYGMPAYYYVASTRPLAKIASPQTLAQYQLGLANLQPKAESTHWFRKGEPFRLAAIRIRQRQKLYAEAPDGVEFLSYSLFRVRVPVPATAARGEYTAEVYLFRDGTVASAQTTPLFVEQVGLERRLFNLAHQWPLEYGLAAVAMAMLLGWGSSLLFRRPG
jgi:uncharacterized protein (TIGR02186 family)